MLSAVIVVVVGVVIVIVDVLAVVVLYSYANVCGNRLVRNNITSHWLSVCDTRIASRTHAYAGMCMFVLIHLFSSMSVRTKWTAHILDSRWAHRNNI